MTMLDRRRALQFSATASTALIGVKATAADNPLEIIDTNVHLGRWPFRRVPLDDARKLSKKLTSLGVREAWAGSFEALLHRDVRSVNARLASACAASTLFQPIGAINPTAVDWKEDLRICIEQHGMFGVRIYPNYHGYTLASSNFRQLLAAVAKLGCLLQIAVAMEDTRTQHPSVRAADVDVSPLPDAMKQHTEATVQLLNFRPRASDLAGLAETPNLYFDTARVESTDGVPVLAQAAPARTLFGSHAPLLIPEAAVIRVHESNRLSADELRAVYQISAGSLAAPMRKRLAQ